MSRRPDIRRTTRTLEPQPTQKSTTRRDHSTAADTERRTFLLARRARHIPPQDLDQLRDTVVALVMQVPRTTDTNDRGLISTLYRFAHHMQTLHGRFDPAVHLDDAHLLAHFHNSYADLAPSSRLDYLSRLRTIRDGSRTAEPPRSLQHPPYDDIHWAALLNAVHDIAHTRWCRSAANLLALTEGAGLRTAELVHTTGEHIVTAESGLRLLVTNPSKAHREIPLEGDTAEQLGPQQGNPHHLVYPAFVQRSDAVKVLLARIRTHNTVLGEFHPAAARHRWVARLLALPLPATTAFHLADITPGQYTTRALFVHAGTPTPDQAHTDYLDALQHPTAVERTPHP